MSCRYIYVCVLIYVSVTHIHTPIPTYTYTDNCSSVLGGSDMPYIVAEARSGPTFFTKLERWLEKMLGPIVAEIFSVKTVHRDE